MKLLDTALTQIGVQEDPAHTNMGEAKKYQDAVGLPHNIGYPWCQSFVYWNGLQAYGAANPVPKTAGVMECWRQAVASPTLDTIEKAAATPANILPGYQGIMDFGKTHPGQGHTFIVESVDANGTIHTVEGNSNPAGGRDGYCVAKHQRHLDDELLKGFICYTDPVES